ncbi:MAG TPA: hypothetical protein VGN97_12130 [Mesorhizobium sp.]|jgi:hypothetical protein|nr:hypothetical protein [Mesorhizobium sp.]
MSKLLGECRCCRKPIHRSQLACPPHWAMLPAPLKAAIRETYQAHEWRTYARNVGEADKIWQDAGLWKPPVPMSRRATKGVEGLRDLLNEGGQP